MDEAKKAQPLFQQLMKNIVNGMDVNPDAVLFVELAPIIDHGHAYTVLTLAPLKGVARCEEKIKNDYEGNHLCMLDLVRGSIVVRTEEQVAEVLQKLLDTGDVVRVKNR